MATAILFKNADLYAPEHKGIKQILTVNDKIIAVEDEISADLPGLEVIDLNGAIVTPGLIDQHIHVTGGGGEGGPLTRAPELTSPSSWKAESLPLSVFPEPIAKPVRSKL